ncbi:MAG: hypothetical protein HFH26_04815 [Clostridiaceae bacterium]|nr:hypothetical protein [Clostridiaceae bacterium]
MANPLLQHYIRLTEFLGQTLGPDYEIALHDMTDKNRSIVAIANGYISGREVGAPLTNIALKILMDRSYHTQDYRLHYRGVSASGRTLRSSTFFIKDGEKLIGMLCINFDDSRYREVGLSIQRLCHPDRFVQNELGGSSLPLVSLSQTAPETESFHNSIDAVASDAVNRELARLGVDADRLTPEERIEIITALEAGGIFLLKGAVKDVADALHCSQASVYRYLSQVKKDE